MKKKYLLYFLVATYTFILLVLATAFSFYMGMDTFHLECDKIETVHFDYQMCNFVKYVFDPITYFLLMSAAVFMIHVWFNAFFPWTIRKNIVILAVIYVVFLLQFYILNRFFYQIHEGFLEGRTSLMEPNSGSIIPHFMFYPITFLITLVGPLLMRIFSWRYHFKFFDNHRVWRYGYHLAGSILFQLISVVLISLIMSIVLISRIPPKNIQFPQN